MVQSHIFGMPILHRKHHAHYTNTREGLKKREDKGNSICHLCTKKHHVSVKEKKFLRFPLWCGWLVNMCAINL